MGYAGANPSYGGCISLSPTVSPATVKLRETLCYEKPHQQWWGMGSDELNTEILEPIGCFSISANFRKGETWNYAVTARNRITPVSSLRTIV